MFHNLTCSLNEQWPPPTIACSISVLITICEPIYHVSHALRTFLADAPGATQHAQKRYPLAWWIWCSKLPHLSCHGSPTTSQIVSSWPTCHYACLMFTTTLANTASLCDLCHFVIWVDKFVVFINPSNQMCVLLVPINVRFGSLKCIMKCVQCLPRHFLAFYM